MAWPLYPVTRMLGSKHGSTSARGRGLQHDLIISQRILQSRLVFANAREANWGSRLLLHCGGSAVSCQVPKEMWVYYGSFGFYLLYLYFEQL
jgi:hypothetical protein